jgi:hypothetical protein
MTVIPLRDKTKIVADAERQCEELDLQIWGLEIRSSQIQDELLALRVRRALYSSLIDSVRMSP